MIEKIEISNFQSHKFSVLEIPEGLSVIAGRTHSGKSSIVRSIKWALQNRPVGDGFRRDGIQDNKPTTVSILFNDDSYIVRERNPKNKSNTYITSRSEEPLEAIRTDVPEEVNEVSMLKQENLMSQGDGYFLIGKTPGKVAAEYNRIVGLDVISKKLSSGKSIISDIVSTIKVIGEQIKKKEEELSDPSFLGINERLERVNNLDCKRKELTVKIENYKSLKLIADEIETEEEVILECEKVLQKEKKLISIKEAILSINSMREKVSSISALIDDIESCEKDKIFFDEILKHAKEFAGIKDKWKAISNLRSKRLTINSLVRDIEKAERTKERALQSVAEGEKIKVDIEKRLNYCSKCGALKANWRIKYASKC